MRVVVQRVKNASCVIDGKLYSQIDTGYLLLVGFTHTDTLKEVKYLAKKIANLRVFEDENGKMNLSVKDINGSALVISNFTLMANYKKGNRPDYMGGAKPQEANRLYTYFCDYLSTLIPTERGEFGADMKVALLNDGPVTIVMDSEVLR
jgi:D-tyrosyl-tRNA(Tyr) deacylase